MARRNRHGGDAEISSDSFLDIIANIVGILIILIVVAGMRVSQAPIFQEEQPATKKTAAAPVQIIGESDAPIWTTQPPQHPEIEPAEPVVIDITEEPDPELFTRHKQQQAEIASLNEQLIQQKSGLSGQELAYVAAEKRISDRERELATLNRTLRDAKSKYDRMKADLKTKQDTLNTLEGESERLVTLINIATEKQKSLAKTKTSNTIELRHDMTPVSSIVKEREIHFLVSNNTVAAVPLELFLDELKNRIQSKASWLLRSNSHTGEIGPIRGFKMKYVVEKEQRSHFDQLRTGSSQIRIVLSQFALSPDDETIVRENVSQATSSTSRYLIAIRSAPPGTTCTFWVHPDSFETYQKLKKYAHESDLRVAGRPLPQGMPITGSPSGSRSAAQ